MNLQAFRKEIDQIDKQMTALFEKRMEICGEIARYKAENQLPVLDSAREQEKLAVIAEQVPAELRDYTVQLYEKLFEISKAYQRQILENKP